MRRRPRVAASLLLTCCTPCVALHLPTRRPARTARAAAAAVLDEKPPVVVDAKCVTGAQVSADGLRVTGDPSGVFVGIAMSKIFGNDKGYFEVRLAKLSDGSKVLIGLGKRDAELDKVRSLCMPPLHTAAAGLIARGADRARGVGLRSCRRRRCRARWRRSSAGYDSFMELCGCATPLHGLCGTASKLTVMEPSPAQLASWCL